MVYIFLCHLFVKICNTNPSTPHTGHTSGQKISIGSVIKDSDLEKKEEVLKELKKLDETCELCLKHKRSAPHQKVGLPLGKGFNSVVAMDFKFIGNSIILHMINTVTRFSVACEVKESWECYLWYVCTLDYNSWTIRQLSYRQRS